MRSEPRIGLWQWRSDTGVITIDQGMRRIYGLRGRSVTKADLNRVVYDEDRERSNLYFAEAFRRMSPINIQYRVPFHDSFKLINVMAHPFEKSALVKKMSGVSVERDFYIGARDELAAHLIDAVHASETAGYTFTTYLLKYCLTDLVSTGPDQIGRPERLN